METSRALEIIDAAVERTFENRGATDETRAALRHLAELGVERSTLVWFWNSLFAENDIGRDQNANASRNRIKHLLKAELRPLGWRADRSGRRDQNAQMPPPRAS